MSHYSSKYVGESFEMVTNGVALFEEIQNGCLQLDSATTGCSNHVHEDVYKLLASQLERGNGDWRIRTETQNLNLWPTL